MTLHTFYFIRIFFIRITKSQNFKNFLRIMLRLDNRTQKKMFERMVHRVCHNSSGTMYVVLCIETALLEIAVNKGLLNFFNIIEQVHFPFVFITSCINSCGKSDVNSKHVNTFDNSFNENACQFLHKILRII